MKKSELRQLIREEINNIKENEPSNSIGKTILKWEKEISDPESVKELKKEILNLKSWEDVVDYYIDVREWDNELLKTLCYFLASQIK